MPEQIPTVFRKELLDIGRDLKAVLPALLMPLLFAVMTYGTIVFLVNMQDKPQAFELPVAGADRAVPLMNALREAGIAIGPAPEDPIAAVREGNEAMVLIVPEDFNARFRAQKRAQIELVWDVSRVDSHSDVNHVRQQLLRWSATTGALRLLVRGVSPETAQVLAINDVNVASDQQMVSKMLAGLPMIILLLAFVGGAGICSEMAAGERENNTLEPVLTTPVSHVRLFAGKWSAAIAFTLVLTLLGVALQLIAVALAPVAELGLRSTMGLGEYAVLMVVLIPVVILATAVQLLVSFLSKSFKDAQTYNQLLTLMPVVPGIYVLLSNSQGAFPQMLVPLLGPQLLIVDVFAGEAVTAGSVLVTTVSSLTVAALCAAVAIRLMKREA